MYYDRLKARVEATEGAYEVKNRPLEPLRKHIAPVYYPLDENIQRGQYEYYNLPGGRGSCKSSFISLEIVSGIMQDPTGESSAIVFRRYASGLRDSVFSQTQWAIDELGATGLWRSSITPMKLTYTPTGAEILFKGLDDPSKIKSIKPKKGVFRYVWIEEFCELPGENFNRNVMQSVVRGSEKFFVFRSFNPPVSANNWANKYVATPDEKTITFRTTYKDVPPEWLGQAFLYEADRLQAVNEKAYRNEYLGECTGSGGEVFNNLEIRPITDEEMAGMEYTYNGLDFGFANDPACFIHAAYSRKTETIYILDEIYQRGLSNAALAQEIKDRGYEGNLTTLRLYGYPQTMRESLTICADAAEPKSIADMQAAGFKCYACYKAAGCVQYRTKWLQRRTIVIDPKRTPNAYREFTAYEYATTKDGEIISDLVDAENHSIDALAYALDREIYKRKNTA